MLNLENFSALLIVWIVRRAKKIIALLLVVGCVIPISSAKLSLFSSNDNKFIGCLDCSKHASDSICSKYGRYGSKYSSSSIWNKYGRYGSKYSSYSPWNKYSARGPKIVDQNDNSHGRFSVNKNAGFARSAWLKNIYEDTNGDLERVKNLFCDA